MSLNNHIYSTDIPKVLYGNRYFDQKGFSFLVCGGLDKNYNPTNQVLEVKIPSFKVYEFPFMKKPSSSHKLATICSEIFAVVDDENYYESLVNSCTFVESYSEETKTWKHQHIYFEEQFDFSLCSFLGKVYIIGGWSKTVEKTFSSCSTYDMKSNKWNKIADLNLARYFSACTVFEGKIVVAGGNNYDHVELKSVEAYDYYENKWTHLPDMIEKRNDHAAVSIGNKLFVMEDGILQVVKCLKEF